jgi:hypothetical protein
MRATLNRDNVVIRNLTNSTWQKGLEVNHACNSCVRTSMMRPFGKPPPRAMSRVSAPLGIVSLDNKKTLNTLSIFQDMSNKTDRTE